MRQKTLLAIFLILGIIDASYLTVTHFLPSALKCPTISSAVNCERVTTSGFSTIFGVPIAIPGLIWFVASLFFLIFGYNEIVKNLWMILGIGGVIYSVSAQVIIGNVCIYCALLDVLIALSVGLFVYYKKG
jgi:uncharacterized membrane protein